MTWTYTATPATIPRDEIRFLVGDTNDLDQLVQDEEITYILGIFPKVAGRVNYYASAEVADAIAAKLARSIDKSIGSLSKQDEQKYLHYVELARRLRLYAATGGRIRGGVGIPVLSGGGDTYLMGDWP